MEGIELKTIGDAMIYLGALAAAVAAIGVVARYAVLQPLKRWLNREIRAPVVEVRDEMSPNGGESLRDAINRIEIEQRQLAVRFTDHLTNHPGC